MGDTDCFNTKKYEKNENTNRDVIDNEFKFKHALLNQPGNISRIASYCCSHSNNSVDWLHFILKHKQCNLFTVFEIAWRTHQWDKVSFLFVCKYLQSTFCFCFEFINCCVQF